MADKFSPKFYFSKFIPALTLFAVIMSFSGCSGGDDLPDWRVKPTAIVSPEMAITHVAEMFELSENLFYSPYLEGETAERTINAVTENGSRINGFMVSPREPVWNEDVTFLLVTRDFRVFLNLGGEEARAGVALISRYEEGFLTALEAKPEPPKTNETSETDKPDESPAQTAAEPEEPEEQREPSEDSVGEPNDEPADPAGAEDTTAPVVTAPSPETTTAPPPETTTASPPETTTAPPPETTTAPPPETTTAPSLGTTTTPPRLSGSTGFTVSDTGTPGAIGDTLMINILANASGELAGSFTYSATGATIVRVSYGRNVLGQEIDNKVALLSVFGINAGDVIATLTFEITAQDYSVTVTGEDEFRGISGVVNGSLPAQTTPPDFARG